MRQTKRFAVVGSDARQAAAGRALARAGYTVGGVQQLPQALCVRIRSGAAMPRHRSNMRS